MRLLIVTSVSIFISCSCVTITPKMLEIRAHEQYSSLSSDERDLTEDIMSKASGSSREEYYFQKLTLLLDTKTVSVDETRAMNRREIRTSVKESKRERRIIASKSRSGLEEYLSHEEFYENAVSRKWSSYQPKSNSPFFYVVDTDPLDILIHIRIRLHGDYNMVSKIILLEDAIEKHLGIPGYSVNLVFIGYSLDDKNVFDVDVIPGKWATSHNWAGGYKTLAHELLHLMGLPDEYDKIENHAGNKNMVRLDRLRQFLAGIDENLPSDAMIGIMCFHNYKPLQRHVCVSVGLGDECIQARRKVFD